MMRRMASPETYAFEATATDGRHVRIEYDAWPFFDPDQPVLERREYRAFIDGEQIDATDLAYRHDGDAMVLVTSIGDLTLT